MFSLQFNLDALNYINMYIHWRAHTKKCVTSMFKVNQAKSNKGRKYMAEDGFSGDCKSANIACLPLDSLSHSYSMEECLIENILSLGNKRKNCGVNGINLCSELTLSQV